MNSPISNIVVFDLETTGLKPEANAILEIACCPFNHDLVDLKEYESGVMKVYGDREINDGALKANGITMQQINSGRDPSIVIQELIKYFDSMRVGRNKPILAGHNIDKFDIPFLQDFFKFFKQDLSKYINLDFTIDTMWWARLKWKEANNYKLGTCCETEGVELVDAHRAITDTRSNKALVKVFIKSLKSGVSQEKRDEYQRPVFQF